jgi:hypothetical protein
MNVKLDSLSGAKWLALIAAAGVLAGCGGEPIGPPPAAPAVTAQVPPFEYRTRTGTPVARPADPNQIRNLVASRSFGTRNDPFALLPAEQSFDRSQLAERVLNETGGFSAMFTPPVEVPDTTDVVEPQPYRRLAGILVGDTVSAILIMEDGSAHLIKPGMRIPNSPWRVVSIDEEKAVLRRAGDRKPTQIVIRLESPPAGAPGSGGGAPQNQGGGGRMGGDDVGGGGGAPSIGPQRGDG